MGYRKRLFEAIATFIGTVIGAGILGIPYVVAEAGFWTGVAVILFLGAISMLLYLYLGEVVLRTNGTHQLTGYAEKYLGKIGKKLMAFSMAVGIYGAMIAFIIGEGTTLAAIFNLTGKTVPILGYAIAAETIFSIVFFIIVSIIIYEGINAVGESEMYLLPVMVGVIFLICAVSFFYINPSNLTGFDIKQALLPYGVIFFAFLGATAIPEMQQEFRDNQKGMKKAIMIGIALPAILYIVFSAAVVGVSGKGTTQVATIGLGESIGPLMIFAGNIFAVFSMATTFLALGLALHQMYEYDYNYIKPAAWVFTCLPPLAVALSGVTSFIGMISLGGVIAGGIDGVLIVLMAHKAKKEGERKPEYQIPVHWAITTGLIILFLIGAGYYFYSMI